MCPTLHCNHSHTILVNSLPQYIEFFKETLKYFLDTAVFHAVWVIGMQVTLDWTTHKPKTNAYFCAVHASVKVVKMNKTIWKNICLLEKKKKTSQAFKSKYICHKESQMFQSFPISLGRQLDFQLRVAFQFLKYYCFLILVWDFGQILG